MSDISRRGYDRTLLIAYFFYAVIAAAFFCLNVPPFQNPDETNHLLRADSIARGHIVGHRFGNNDAGGIASPEIDLSGRPFDWLKFYPDRKVKQSMYDEAFRTFHEKGKDITFRNTALYPPFFYVPSVVAIYIGKAEHLTVIQTLYLSRIATSVATLALVMCALYICFYSGLSGAGLMIFSVATLPMSLSLQNACSQDGLMIGVSAISAALFARFKIAPQTKTLWSLVIALSMLAMARPPYIFLALLPFALQITWRSRVLAAGIIVVSSLIWTLIANHYVATEMAERGANIYEQLKVVINPVHDIQIFVHTLDLIGWQYLNQVVGQLGWLDVTLPRWYVYLALAVIALSALAGLELRTRSAVISLVALMASFISIFGLIYLSWDTVGAALIEGVQGRYFIPLLLILGGSATTLIRPGGRAIWALTAVFPILSLTIAMRAVVIRYYLGQ